MLFQKEIDSGFTEEQLFSSIAYEVDIKIEDKTSKALEIVTPFFPFKNINNQKDLFPFESILASTGKNKNGDVFLKEELFAAKDTPVDKPINSNHVYNNIIGHMVGSIAVDSEGNVLDGPEIPDTFDIVVGGVLYKNWTEAEDIERMRQIFEDIENQKLKVSMECYFDSFDYAVYKSDGVQLIERTSETSFLTKHLRWYGGTGSWEGHEVGRVLRNLYFSGKGLVENQANERSIILNTNANKIEDKKEKSMSDENKTYEIALASVKEAHEGTVDKLIADSNAKEENFRKTVDELNATIACHVAKAEKMNKEKDEEMEEMLEKSESFEKRIAELEEANKAALAEVDSLKAEIAKANSEKLVAQRLAKLTQAGLDDEKAQEVIKTWANANDEQFEQVVSLLPKKSEANDLDLDDSEVETDSRLSSASNEDYSSLAEELMSIAQESCK